MSLYGSHVSLLPAIHLSMTIDPENAKRLRHPKEEQKAIEEMDVHSVEGLKTALQLEEEEEEDAGQEFRSQTQYGNVLRALKNRSHVYLALH